MEKIQSFWEDLKFRLGIGINDVKKNESIFVGMGSNSNEILENLVKKTPKIKRLNPEQIIIYKNYLKYNLDTKNDPFMEMQEELIEVLDILGMEKHNFDIELTEQYIHQYANENNMDYDLALSTLVIDIISDREETKDVFKMAKKYRDDNSNPHPISLMTFDEQRLYSRFKETNIMKTKR